MPLFNAAKKGKESSKKAACKGLPSTKSSETEPICQIMNNGVGFCKNWNVWNGKNGKKGNKIKK